jgi:hypothetical protein
VTEDEYKILKAEIQQTKAACSIILALVIGLMMFAVAHNYGLV